MNKLILSIFVSFLFFTGVSQTLTFEDASGNDLTGQVRIINGSNAPGYITEAIFIRNNSQGTIDARVRRYELNVQPNTQNYFCWGLCFAEMDAGQYPVYPTTGGADNIPLGSDETGQLDVYHRPEGLMGTSTYRYVVYDQMNPTDSSYVDVQFNVFGVSVAEVAIPEMSFYPNPADNNVFIQFKNPTQDLRVELIDLLGKTVKQQSVSASTQVVLGVSDLSGGVYFIRLSDRNKVYSTKKIVVKH